MDVACSLGSGALSNLDLQASGGYGFQCGGFLTRQTALTQLRVGGRLCSLWHIGALRLGLLQSLKLRHLTSLGAEGLSALSKAPSLTRLHMSISNEAEGVQLPSLHLSRALGGLTQLRSLALWPSAAAPIAKFLDYALTLPRLMGLTQLEIMWGHLDDGDVRALLVLTNLRVLKLSDCCLTDAILPEMGALTSLRTLRLKYCGVTSLAPLTEILNPLRDARGWPPIDAMPACECFEW